MCTTLLTRLGEDHRRFERLFTEIERQCAALEGGSSMDEPCVRAIVAYLRDYKLPLHYALEEAIYAKLLQVQPRFRDIYDLVEDHHVSRREFGAFVAATVPPYSTFVDAARSFIGNERGHFIAEEEIFFPYAEKHVGAEQWLSLAQVVQEEERTEDPKPAPIITKLIGRAYSSSRCLGAQHHADELR